MSKVFVIVLRGSSIIKIEGACLNRSEAIAKCEQLNAGGSDGKFVVRELPVGEYASDQNYWSSPDYNGFNLQYSTMAEYEVERARADRLNEQAEVDRAVRKASEISEKNNASRKDEHGH